MKNLGHLKPKGFTLIELLVVIAIIALLSTIAGVALNSARQKGRDAKRVADIRQIQTALELGFDSALDFPAQGTDVAPIALGATAYSRLCQDGNTVAAADYVFDSACEATTTVYMAKVARDPSQTGDENGCLAGDTAVCDYAYAHLAALQYEIRFVLEGAAGGLSAGLNCASEAGITATTCVH